ncbi:hypothetical protein [Pseudomonas sp. K5002]|uniref:hypothetical protein n=1 Tax=Pseudomonas sp. K5002 TaxID=2738828 RepID=UPI0015B89805|nr:hypothetical protein [Pseudomonas sp. K5002]NWD89917.1 hypothetical protein [Pseudomonas sp. K5002]
MQMLVSPMRRHGVALTPRERRNYQAIKGNVMVNSENNAELGRSANVARLEVGMPLEHDPLPRLLDATLAGMAVTGFVLSGIEYIDGCAYAQSWWCREE